MALRVMIVHASRVIRTALGNLIDQQSGFNVCAAAASIHEATQLLAQPAVACDLILVDGALAQPGSVSQLLVTDDVKVVMLSDAESDGSLDACVKEGARGVIDTDADVTHLVKALTKVYEGEYWLNRQTTSRLLSTLGHSAKVLSDEQVKINSLTAKEALVVQAVFNGNGQSLHKTAQTLQISENTLRNHLTAIYAKLGVANRTELFIFAQQHLA